MLIALGILLLAYVCFLDNGFLFSFFKESFNQRKMLLKSYAEGLTKAYY